MKSPFKFLDAYGPEDRKAFFGRDMEIEQLYTMVFKTPLLLVYGLSGTGKTSLIQCGLSNRFDGTDWNPFFVRRGEDLNESLRETMQEAMPSGSNMPEAIPDMVRDMFRHYLRPVYLIFDQFEELFILGTKEEQEIFADTIKTLIAQELPCKILLIMREEFLAQLYTIEKEVPSVYDYRLRVERMGYPKVQQVLQGSFEQFNIKLEDEKDYETIYENVSAGKFGVQLPYLQVYLDMFYREDFAKSFPGVEELPDPLPELTFSSDEIDAFGRIEEVLARFLENQEGDVKKELLERYPDTDPAAVRKVLDSLVTEEGTKRPLPIVRVEGEIHLPDDTKERLPNLSEDAVVFALTKLEQSRLLFERDGALELAHDSLAALIDERRTDEQRQLNELKRRLNSDYASFLDTNEHLSRKQLAVYDPYKHKMGLSPTLLQYLEDSERAATDKEQEELRRQQEILDATQAKLAAEQQARKRQRVLLIGMIGLVAVAVVLGISAKRANIKSQELAEVAEQQRIAAEDSKTEALEALAKQQELEIAKIIRDAKVFAEAEEYGLAIQKLDEGMAMDTAGVHQPLRELYADYQQLQNPQE